VTTLTAALVAPTVTVHASYLAAIGEYHNEGRYTDLDLERLGEPAVFGALVETLLAKALPETPRPEGIVPETTLWWVDGEEFLGRVSIRHQLTEALRNLGGHIGYDVRPTARRRRHATAMLRVALPLAARLCIDPALVTCDVDNVASRRVIEANGGTLDQVGEGRTLQFWVPTGARP
jgi:predicted acetyltransferase